MEESQEMHNQSMQEDEFQKSDEKMGVDSRRIAELEAQLAQVKQAADENWNKYLRERAEMENFRKRQERLAGERVAYEKKAVLRKIVEVVDNVERGLIYQESMDKQGLQHTLRMLLWQLGEVLRGEGLSLVPALGEVLDVRIHDAVEVVESEQPRDTIVEEVLKGYKLGDETFRPARVKVSSGTKSQQGQND